MLKIRTERCKGCSLCVSVCPKKILELDKKQVNANGYTPCKITDQKTCIECAMCATICPDCVITIVNE